MRHGMFGRALSRSANERRRLFMLLAREMIEHGTIRTTFAKAKAVQPLVEKLVTKAKDGSEHARRQAFKVLADRALTAKLFDDAKTQFAARNSGFTRVVKLGMRRGDATEEALLTFVDEKVVAEVVKQPSEKIKVKSEKLETKTEEKKLTKKPVARKTKVAKKTK